eukprot:7086884-Prymnesium_polylepis.2
MGDRQGRAASETSWHADRGKGGIRAPLARVTKRRLEATRPRRAAHNRDPDRPRSAGARRAVSSCGALASSSMIMCEYTLHT